MQLEPFCKLANPASYVACDWDLRLDEPARHHWLGFFKRHLETILARAHGVQTRRGQAPAAVAAALAEVRRYFHRLCDDFGHDFATYPPVTIHTLVSWRDASMRKFGFYDSFIDLKDRENEAALKLLPAVCRQIDSLCGQEQFRTLIEGVFAGNIFDMGAEATAAVCKDAAPDFFATRAKLPLRPWLYDDFDALAQRMLSGDRHGKAVFFIDNAGSDFLLGALPLIRFLAIRGTAVALVANEYHTLNDMTIHDVAAWWPRIIAVEPSLASLPIHPVTSGTGESLIDLGQVSPQLNQAACDADLLILEGMGRAVESNLDAAFTCDTLKIAMVKDPMVAQRCHGKIYDLVCRFNQG